MAGSSTVARAREQVVRLSQEAADSRTLRLETLAVLRRVIGFDAYVWLMTDPETSVGSAPLADVPCLPELPRLIRLKYLTTSIAGQVTAGLRRCQAATFAAARGAERADAGPLVLLLSAGLSVRAQTPETERYLRLLVPPDNAAQPPVPAGALNVGAQLLANEAGVDANPPFSRVHLGSGHWLTMRAARMDSGQPLEERDIAVSIEATGPAGRVTLFARAHGLSPREAELLGHAAAGADTRDIARLMFLSEHTVQAHLKSVFAKTGIRSRPALLARVLGT
jgi:DNA-binding CsgD family transcriptional regulator